MTEERARRKLSGILSVDAVGYSRLMRQDEAATVATLKGHKDVMASLIERYRGRVVDSPQIVERIGVDPGEARLITYLSVRPYARAGKFTFRRSQRHL